MKSNTLTHGVQQQYTHVLAHLDVHKRQLQKLLLVLVQLQLVLVQIEALGQRLAPVVVLQRVPLHLPHLAHADQNYVAWVIVLFR